MLMSSPPCVEQEKRVMFSGRFLHLDATHGKEGCQGTDGLAGPWGGGPAAPPAFLGDSQAHERALERRLRGC